MADIVPIELTLDEREVFTLYAPRWRDASDEWEAFLGKDEDLYAFTSVPDLVAFIRSDNDNDLTDHPAWERLTSASAHRLDPRDDKRFDLINVYELLAEKPTAESVRQLTGDPGHRVGHRVGLRTARDQQVLQREPGAVHGIGRHRQLL